MNANDIHSKISLIATLLGCALLVGGNDASALEDMECEQIVVCRTETDVLEGMECERRSLIMNYVRPFDVKCPASAVLNRSYILCVPSKLKLEPKPASLVLAFHGAGESSSGLAFQNKVHFEVRGLTDNFITAYPNGCRLVEDQIVCDGGSWNAQGDPPRGMSEKCKINDAFFIDQVINDIQSHYPISRIIAYGHSKGGMFAYSLACDRPRVFSAIGVTAATLTDVTCDLPEGVSIFHVHNLMDQSVPFEGGGIEFDWPSAKKGLYFWAIKNRCVLPINAHDFSEDMCLEAFCQTGLSVELCLLDVAGGDPNIDPILPHRYQTYDAAFMAGNKNHENIRDAFLEKCLK